MQKVLIIIPAYNEEEALPLVVSNILKIKIKGVKLDYVIINDGSLDNTLNVCKANNYNYLNLVNNLGIGGAVQTGYKYAYYKGYDIAIQFDGDNQHDASFFGALINEVNNGNDLIIGSRYIGNLSQFQSSFIRRFGGRFLSNLIYFLTKKRIYDVTSGFRACNYNLIKYFAFNYPLDYPEPDSLVQALKLGFKVKEIPVIMHERKTGKSSLNIISGAYYMIKVTFAIIIASLSTRGGKND